MFLFSFTNCIPFSLSLSLLLAETFPKQARPKSQSRRPSEALARHVPKVTTSSAADYHHHENGRSQTEKPLMAQLKQKIIGHQQPGPSTASNTAKNRTDPSIAAPKRPLMKREPIEPLHFSFSPQTHQENHNNAIDYDAMDLSVRKGSASVVAAAAPVEVVPDWRTMEGAGNRFPCRHCPKVFNKEGQLYLHSRVHEMGETSTKAERKSSKARSERCSSPGSVSATSDNPRPFFCAECNVGFRIHGMYYFFCPKCRQ